MSKSPRVTFSNAASPFFDTLKKKVDGYFANSNISQTGNKKLFSKAVILFSSLIIIYTLLVFFTPENTFLALALCGLLGLNFAAIGFNVMHDGAHGSFSTKTKVNDIMSYSLNAMGASSFMWKIKHNFNHHTYTNIEDMDDDIDIQPFMRVTENHDKYWFHKYQHIYFPIMYSLTYILWVFYLDFLKYFTGKIAEIKIKKMKTSEHIWFWATKVIYIAVFLIIPSYVHGFGATIIGYVTAAVICGFTISIIFQLAHVVEGPKFPLPNENNKIQSEWAVHQLETTANFAPENKFISWLVGGLNYQVEHHLFPKISHVHYPQIRKLVKETCAQYNISYHEFPTFWGAVKSHILFLKTAGVA
jgi:linoleoyl-CoA desaturase